MTVTVDIPLDIYRKNAFRILGLPVSAKLRQAKRRAASLVALIESKDQASLREEVIGGITDLPDEAAVREASHRLESPLIRLVDELFWFAGTDGMPLDLSKGLIEARVWEWLEEEILDGPEAVSATRNLATFYHLIVLQIEDRIAAMPEGDDDLRRAYWDEAEVAWRETLSRWTQLQSNDRFRDWFDARFEAVSVGRLEDTSPAELLTACSAGPLGQLIQLGFDHGRANRFDETRRLRKVALDNGVTEEGFVTAGARRLQDKADALLLSIETTQKTLTSAIDLVKQKSEDLMDRVLPDIDVLRVLLGRDHHIPSSLGDAVATAVNRAQLEISDKLKDYAGCREILGRVKHYASSPELTPVLDGNFSFLTCQFCGHAPREDGQILHFTICKITRHTPYTGPTEYQRMTVEVPRCGSCARAGRSSFSKVADYPEIKEKLDQGWLPRSEPSPADIERFMRQHG